MSKSKSKKNSSQPKKAKRRRRQNRSGVTRALLKTTLPKPFFRSAGSERHTVVHGCEVVAELTCSVGNKTVLAYLDPSNSTLFPRLAAAAKMYERYRFRRVWLEYHPGCPATRSGAIGLAILSDPTRSVDASLVELAAYQSSAVGAVPGAVCTQEYVPQDPAWYVAEQSSVSQIEIDPLKRFQGRLVWMTDNADTGDDGLFAGYVSVHYEVHFAHMRPQPDIGALLVASDQSWAVPASPSAEAYPPFDNIEANYGWFDFVKLARAYAEQGVSIAGDLANLNWSYPVNLIEAADSKTDSEVVSIGSLPSGARSMPRSAVPPREVSHLKSITPFTEGGVEFKWTLHGVYVFEGSLTSENAHEVLNALAKRVGGPMVASTIRTNIYQRVADANGVESNLILYTQDYPGLTNGDHTLTGAVQALIDPRTTRCFPLVYKTIGLSNTASLDGTSYFGLNLLDDPLL